MGIERDTQPRQRRDPETGGPRRHPEDTPLLDTPVTGDVTSGVRARDDHGVYWKTI